MDYIGAGGTLLSKDCISFQTTAKGGNHMKSQRIRIGSRASRLAVIQSEWVMQQIHQIAPEIQLELVGQCRQRGTRFFSKTLDQIGGKGLFLKELDAALSCKRSRSLCA